MDYKEIINHYEKCFKKFGDTARGVDWTKEEQVDIRYQVMLEITNFYEKSYNIDKNISILDFGCGLSQFYEYINKNDLNHVEYTGLEISKIFFEESKKKYPKNLYIFGDILKNGNLLNKTYDYIILNGVFTEKRDLSYDYMFNYLEKMIVSIFKSCTKGMAFNLMSKQVDWEVETLFHVPIDDIANLLTKKITRNFIVRNDYGLYEYTVYVYK
jgi:SAM-dependent methyltransferase